MKERMRIHVFKVKRGSNSGSLANLLLNIQTDPLSKRMRNINFGDIRIEHIVQTNGNWYFDFGTIRDQHGPGKASANKPTQGFVFGTGESFCEETACLYIPSSDHLIVQYNHHGARVGRIQDYLCDYDHSGGFTFELLPRYDQSVETKFKNRAATKKITFSIDPRLFNMKDRENNVALTSALDIGQASGGETVEISIRAGTKKGKFLSSPIDTMANILKRVAGTNPDSVKKLQVGVVNQKDSNMELLDLLEHRLVTSFDMRAGADKRFPQQDRYDALTRAYNGWKKIL